MNKRDLGYQREDRILVAEEDSSRNPRASLPAVILINLWVGLIERSPRKFPMFYLAI
jgi:hypothetical protein